MKNLKIIFIIIFIINLTGCATENLDNSENNNNQTTKIDYKYYHNGNLLTDDDVINDLLVKAEATEYNNDVVNIYLTKSEALEFENKINYTNDPEGENSQRSTIAQDLSRIVVVYDGRVSWGGVIRGFSAFDKGPLASYYSSITTHFDNGTNVSASLFNLVTTPHGKIIHLINGSKTSGYVVFCSGTNYSGQKVFARINARSHGRAPGLSFTPLSHAVSAYIF